MDQRPPRTRLEQLIRSSKRTIAEHCHAFEATARQHREPATLGYRQLARWKKGDVTDARLPSQRVAELHWGEPFEVLVGPPTREADETGRRAVTNDLDVRVGDDRPAPVPEDDAVAMTDAPPTWCRATGLAGGHDPTAPLASTATAVMEFTRRAEASDLGPRTLEHLEAAIADMARAFAHTPPQELFAQAAGHRDQVARFIEGQQTLRQKRDLFRYAGWLSVILGWLSHDLGDPVAAEALCIDAWQHGWEADDGEVCGWAMDTMATVAMYTNRPRRARDAARQGLDVAPRGKAVHVRLGCQLARAHGRLGQAGQFDDALTTIRRQLDGLPEQGSDLFSVDTGRIASYAATSSLWLARDRDAVCRAEEALAFYAGADPAESSPTREAISRLDLGLALIATRRPDAAAEEALRALACERITSAVLARAHDVDLALQRRHAGLAEADEVHTCFQALVADHVPRSRFTPRRPEQQATPAAHPGWLR